MRRVRTRNPSRNIDVFESSAYTGTSLSFLLFFNVKLSIIRLEVLSIDSGE